MPRLHSHWVRVSESSEDLALAGAEAVQAARAGWGKIAHAYRTGQPCLGTGPGIL